VDEVLVREPRRVDPPALDDRHSILNPQERLAGRELRQEKSGPTTVAWMSGEQFRQGWLLWLG